jgi:hypothetical protein
MPEEETGKKEEKTSRGERGGAENAKRNEE